MFTGIVEEIGAVTGIDAGEAGTKLGIAASFAGELREGDSVSVEGVCLTATVVRGDGFDADVMNQTLSLSTLGGLTVGSRVNLEQPVRAGEPFGGHIVQGHVDGIGEVRARTEDGLARRLRIAVPGGL